MTVLSQKQLIDIQTCINQERDLAGLKYLGHGTYNAAVLDQKTGMVIKFKLKKEDQNVKTSLLDKPERSVALWNQINPNLERPAELCTDPAGNVIGWACPFVKGTAPNDSELSKALIDVYQQTGRIVLDGFVGGNFKQLPNGNVMCVDIGMAFLLFDESQDETCRSSVVSLDAWTANSTRFFCWLNDNRKLSPQSVETIQALLFINAHYPHLDDLSFLQERKIRKVISIACVQEYKKSKGLDYDQSIIDQSLRILQEKRLADPVKQMKDICKREIESYIKTRAYEVKSNTGEGEIEGKMKLTLFTYLFRNRTLSTKKVTQARRLLKTIEKADSLKEIYQHLNSAHALEKPNRSLFTKGFSSSIGKCMICVESMQQQLDSLKNRIRPSNI